MLSCAGRLYRLILNFPICCSANNANTSMYIVPIYLLIFNSVTSRMENGEKFMSMVFKKQTIQARTKQLKQVLVVCKTWIICVIENAIWREKNETNWQFWIHSLPCWVLPTTTEHVSLFRLVVISRILIFTFHIIFILQFKQQRWDLVGEIICSASVHFTFKSSYMVLCFSR